MAEGPKVRTVADVMTTDVVTASAAEPLASVCDRMLARRVGSVVVTDGDAVVGILTERDLVRTTSQGSADQSATVGDWMTPEPESVGPDLDVNEAFARLHEQGFRHFPVVDDKRLVGVVSLRDMVGIAQVRPVKHPSLVEAPRGLEGVVVAETEVGDVRGQEGFYHYRQYDACELAAKRTLEDVWYLLYNGRLPSRDELGDFVAETKELRTLPRAVSKLLPDLAAAGERFVPLDAIRSAYSLLANAADFQSWMDVDQARLRSDAMKTSAVMPTLIMALWRLRQGLEPIDPNPYLPYAANYLYMLTGEVPSHEHARAIDQYLILTADHGFNASTFTGRVITSTGADLGAAVVGAIGALSGPLHGGAPSRALDMLDAIGSPDRADAWIREDRKSTRLNSSH